MKSKYLLFLLLLLLFSCDNVSKSELIIGDWDLASVETNQIITNEKQYKSAINQLIQTTSLQLYSDKSFSATIWGDTSYGYWNITDDSLVIYDQSNETEFKAAVIKVSENQLVISETAGSIQEVLIFER